MGLLQSQDIEITYPGNLGYPITMKFNGGGTFTDPYKFPNVSLHNFTRSLGTMNMRGMQCFPDIFYAEFKGIKVKIISQREFVFIDIPEDIKNQLEDEVNSNLADIERCYKEG